MVKNIGVVLSIVAIVLAGLALAKPVPVVTDNAGALSSPDLPFRYLSVGGVTRYMAKTSSLTQASTVVCALQSPAATSTLVSGQIRFSVSSTTASTVTLARSSSSTATTTSLGSITIPANAQGIAVASTTGNHIFSPSTYFTVGMAGGIGTFSPTGVCEATWEVI